MTSPAMPSSEDATIYALSTPPGRGGVAVVRVSGPRAHAVLEIMCGGLPLPRRAEHRIIKRPGSGERLDRGIVIWFPGPQSFTGEDVTELHLHGGRAVVDAVLDAVGQLPGLVPAEAGAFARRAFDNGKMDLAEVEGLSDLIDAETDEQRRQAFAQASGSLSRLYDGWRETLIEALGLVEAALDFSDEGDVGDRAFQTAKKIVSDLAPRVNDHLNDGHRGEILRDGFRVALVGAPNVGKSSLLNALARRDAAIVSEEAGTTRDVIEVRLDLGGFPVIVSDTAGLRKTTGAVEQEGIRRSLVVASDANLILWMVDASITDILPPDELRPMMDKVVPVGNKVDLTSGDGTAQTSPDAIFVSALTGHGLDVLQLRLTEYVRSSVGQSTGPALSQTRHRTLVAECARSLSQFLSGDEGDVELRAEDLRLALHALGRIVGRVDVEEILDNVFGRFCIGK